MTAKDLKNALLQEAVQGKLVPQIASEGNARDLLEEIKRSRHSELVSESKNKAKKEKPLPEITEEDIPFDIPENWCWCRLDEISTNITAGGDKPSHFSKTITEKLTVPVISNGEKDDGVFGYTDRATVTAKAITVSGRGNIGFTKVRNEPFMPIVRLITITFPNILDFKYLEIAISFLVTDGNGSAVQQLTVPMIKPLLIPLPPLAEQKRIVAAIEKFMPIIEEYGKKETELKAFNEQIGTLTKKAILQEAVQGKLVPQIAAEGNAKDLLEEIKKEKTKLIKEGKIKKEKTLPEITEDEIPFDIPESWCWCRLGEIVQLTSGQDLQPEMYNSSQKGIPYITGASNFNNGNVIINRWTETPKSVAIKDDLLLTCKGTVGEMAFLKEKKVHIARQVMSIRSSEKISLGYVKIYLTTQIENLKSKAKSMIPGIAREDVISSLIPLPPLSEQKRIAAAIKKMLPLCEKLGE